MIINVYLCIQSMFDIYSNNKVFLTLCAFVFLLLMPQMGGVLSDKDLTLDFHVLFCNYFNMKLMMNIIIIAAAMHLLQCVVKD